MFKHIKLAVFKLAEAGKNDEAKKLMDDCELSEEFRKKLILPLVEPQISALSAGFESQSVFMMTLNGDVFDNEKVEKNVAGNNRGMNLILIDRLTHEVTKCQSFDTHESENDERKFFEELQEVGPDQIIVLMVSEEGAVKLRFDTKELIKALGSEIIMDLGYREPFALIGCKSKKIKLLEEKNQKLKNRFAFVKNFD